jgi:hypothetical protein
VNIRDANNQNDRTQHYGAMTVNYNGSDNEVLRVYCNATTTADRVAVLGQSQPSNGWGLGARFLGGCIGVKAENIGTAITNRSRMAGYFTATGPNSTSQLTIGVFATASKDGGVTTNCWAGYFAGNVYVTGTVTQTSDARLKTESVPLEGCLEKVMALKPCRYSFDTELFPELNLPSGTKMGLLAQEVEAVVPELVSEVALPEEVRGELSSIKGVDYISLVPLLLGAIKEQQAMIQTQSAEIVAIRAELLTLKNR